MSKMTNRELAAMYLARAAEEDQRKIDAFCKAAFTDKMMVDLGFFTVSEFREAGKIISEVLENTFKKIRENEKDDSDGGVKSRRGRKPRKVVSDDPEPVDQPDAGNDVSENGTDFDIPDFIQGGIQYEQN